MQFFFEIQKKLVATSFVPELMSILVEVHFRKMSTIESMWSIIEKFVTFYNFVLDLNELDPFIFVQVAFKIDYCFNVQLNGNYSTEKFRYLNKKCHERSFLTFFGPRGVFMADSNKKQYVNFQKRLLNTGLNRW